jgi:peptidoglycan/xylan/chitin deacetylase (PgdA/CDA1 family)
VSPAVDLVAARRRLRAALVRAVPFAASVSNVDTDEPVIALTFDDGPDPVGTPALLDVLARHDVRATFFLIGERAARHPELVERTLAAGHVVGNHGWDHRSLQLEVPGGWLAAGRWGRAQVRAGAAVLGDRGARYFRAPYGHQDLASRFDAFLAGHVTVGWNLTAGDFMGESGAEIAGRTITRLEPGDIVTFHDGLADAYDPRFLDRSESVDAVDRLLTAVEGRFRCVTVPELLASGAPRYRFHHAVPQPIAGLRATAAPRR